MNKIKFSHNWNNKLNNVMFTTIRSFSEEKFEYYTKNINEEFEIVLNGKVVGKTMLRVAKTETFSDIDDFVLLLDTGLPTLEFIDLFKKFGISNGDKCMILLFSRYKMDNKQEVVDLTEIRTK